MTLGIEREGLAEPLRELVGGGRPTLGTCAGLIMLDRDHLDCSTSAPSATPSAARSSSFEADIDLQGVGEGVARRCSSARRGWTSTATGWRCWPRSTGIRWPCAPGNVLAVAFHPEIDGDTRLHEWLIARVESNNKGGQ